MNRICFVLVLILLSTMGAPADQISVEQARQAVTQAESAKDNELLKKALKALSQALTADYQYVEAARTEKRLYTIVKETAPADSAEVADAAEGLSRALILMGNPFGAPPYVEECRILREEKLKVSPEKLADTKELMGLLGAGMGVQKLVLPYLQDCYDIRLKALGEGHPKTLEALHRLASQEVLLGNYEKGRALHQTGLSLKKTAYGLRGMAELDEKVGDFAQAESSLRQALTLTTDDFDRSLTLEQTGSLLYDVGDYTQAEKLLREALRIQTKLIGEKHITTASTGEQLGLVLTELGQYEEAEKLLLNSYHTHEYWLAAEHTDTAKAFDDLAHSVTRMGKLEEAKALYMVAETVRAGSLGRENPLVGQSKRELADIYTLQDEDIEAGMLYRQALSMHKKVLSLAHPQTVQSCQQAAYHLIEIKKPEMALKLAREADEGRVETLSNVFSFASERQRMRYYQILNPFDLLASLGSAPDILNASLRFKGAVLDSILEDTRLAQQSTDPAMREKVEELKITRQTLMQKLLNDSESEEVAALRARVEELEKELARNTGAQGTQRRALQVNYQQVQEVLPAQTALIEYLKYKQYVKDGISEPAYGALILTSQGEPTWVPLGSAAEIEKSVSRYQAAVRGLSLPSRASRVTQVANTSSIELVTGELYQAVWAPVQKQLPDQVKELVISPDGQLNFVSFVTLRAADDSLLGEKYLLTYVASGRDLLVSKKPSEGNRAELFGDPTFDTQRVSAQVLASDRSVGAESIEGVQFQQLPYTLVECQNLQTLMKKERLKPHMQALEQATEEHVREVKSPKILHLATHGFFLPDDPHGALKNPMLRSGLALVGAQSTIEAWAKKQAPDPANDGILTAQEVGLLKLDGTWLVALSACDTGSGGSRPGQGVLGLRRGFVQAGTQNLLMTLWPVADKETSELMQDFYHRALSSNDAPRALAQTQAEWIKKLRKERGLDSAVKLAGPFVLTFQGRM